MVCPVPWENFYCGIVFSCLQRSSEPRPPETWSPCRLAWAMSGQQNPGRPLWSPLTFPEAVGWPGKAGRPGLEVRGIHVLLDLRLMLFGIFFKKKNTERSFFCNFFYFYFFFGVFLFSLSFNFFCNFYTNTREQTRSGAFPRAAEGAEDWASFVRCDLSRFQHERQD